jgi:type I restriction enzyme, S subunit
MQPYPKYKDSGIEWIGEIPDSYKIKKLKFIANANPSNIDKKSKENEESVLLCNYVDVYKNEYISKNLAFMKATASNDQIEKFKLQRDDVLATKDSESPNDIGNPALVNENLDNIVCGYHLTHIKPKKINGRYLFRYLQSKYMQSYFEISANGITRYGLGVDKFNSALILNPPIEEQKQIASFLDHKTEKIDTFIEKKKKLIDLLKEERTAVINEAVTKGLDHDVKMKDSGIEWLGEVPEHWSVQQLRFACKINYGITLQLDQNKTDGIKIISVRNITFGGDFNFDSEFYIDESLVHDDNILKHGDILFNWRNGSARHVGKTAYFDLNDIYTHVSFLLRIRVSDRFDPFFVKSYLSALRYRGFFAAAKDKVNRTFNSTELNRLNIIIPPKKEQIQIVQYIEQETSRIETISSKTEREIELLQEYRIALISEVVTGKIDVRDWEEPEK